MKLSSSLLSVGLGVLLLSGCATGNNNGVTGSAAGSNNKNANTKIEKCFMKTKIPTGIHI